MHCWCICNVKFDDFALKEEEEEEEKEKGA
jgi:hypothetical protein